MPAEAVAVPLTVGAGLPPRAGFARDGVLGPGLRPSVAWREADKTSSTPSVRGSIVGQAQSRMNDTELIREAQRGNHAAFEELVRQYDGAVLRLAYHLTRSEQDAQDIYQEAFLKAYRNIGNFRFECSFYTWIYRIVTNLCLDLLRKRQVRKEDSGVTTDSEGGTYEPAGPGRGSAIGSQSGARPDAARAGGEHRQGIAEVDAARAHGI